MFVFPVVRKKYKRLRDRVGFHRSIKTVVIYSATTTLFVEALQFLFLFYRRDDGFPPPPQFGFDHRGPPRFDMRGPPPGGNWRGGRPPFNMRGPPPRNWHPHDGPPPR